MNESLLPTSRSAPTRRYSGDVGAYTRINFTAGSVTRAAAPAILASIKRAADTTAKRARDNVIMMGLVNTGRLKDSFRVKTISATAPNLKVLVYSNDPNAHWPEFGRRGFSAAPGHVLRFKPKGSDRWVFAKSVGPVPAYGFMKKARQSVTIADFR